MSSKIKFYSHSKLSTFEQCPFKYKLRYIDKIRPEIEKSIEAHLGTAVHNTLEWVYNTIKENPQKDFSMDEIIEHYIKEWQKDFSDKILVVKKEFTHKDYFDKGVTFLINYYNQHHPFRDGTVECEKKIVIEIDEKTKIQGFIDRLVHDIEKDRLEIHDYKTANTLPTQEKMDSDRQLALYSIAIKEIYGEDKEVLLIWHYLAHQQKIISKRTNKQLENLKEQTKQLIKKIESTKYFPFEKSILCDWCEYKNECPAWVTNSPHTTYIDDGMDETKLNNSDSFPTINKYLVDKKFERKNPADNSQKDLGIF